MSDARMTMKQGKYPFDSINDEDLGLHKNLGKLKKNTVEIEIQEVISEMGATCLVYTGKVVTTDRKVIIKEFYPQQEDETDIWPFTRDEKQQLLIPSLLWETNSKLQERFRQFMAAYTWQKKLYADLKFLETVVEPQYLAMYGDTYYIISDFHNGFSIRNKVKKFKTLQDKIMLMHYLTELMVLLEENNYMLLDICLDNFLVIDQTEEHYQLRMFDLDSIIDLDELDDMHDPQGKVFYHLEYSSNEIVELKKKMKKTCFDDLKYTAFSQSSVVYSLGIVFFELLFGKLPLRNKRQLYKYKDKLIIELIEMYSNELNQKSADELIDMIDKMLSPIDVKNLNGFNSCKTVLSFLKEFSVEMNYDIYLKKDKMLDANATLVAYNMLQEYPLFRYAVEIEDGRNALKVALIGNHNLRSGILSAIISIGQMLNTTLEIAIVDENIQQFWDEYLSENTGLKDTVLVNLDGKNISDTWNKQIVDMPLAEIYLIQNISKETDEELRKKGYQYFVLLEETESKILKHYNILRKSVKGDQTICVACLKGGRELAALEKNNQKGMDLHFISASRVGASYNEEMYKQRVYRMGLKVHSYYEGVGPGWQGNLKKIEEHYQKDFYNMMSSERSALHGIYKLASVGLDINHPGIVQAYLEKLKNPEIVEQLGYLEHRSWNAYMLCSGACPVSVSEMDLYAYRGNNDWKDKSDFFHTKHPLIVASTPFKKLPEDGWSHMSLQEIAKLDPLDKVSYDIYQWYRKQIPILGKKVKKVFEQFSSNERIGDVEEIYNLQIACEQCIEYMCEKPSKQAVKYKNTYNLQRKKIQGIIDKKQLSRTEMKYWKIFFDIVDNLMKLVLDSYKERDYKQLDRDNVCAVLEFILV